MSHARNRGERNRIQGLKYLRRLKRPGVEGTPNCYRTTSTPCSCSLCDPHKWTKEPKHSAKRRQESANDSD